jgi:hypothetical protein
VFLQDKKCGLFPVNRNLIEYVNGQQGVTVSTSVVGTPNYYAGEFGVGNNPESVAVEGGRVYFADIRNGKVIRISQDGITPISEAKMDAYFKDAISVTLFSSPLSSKLSVELMMKLVSTLCLLQLYTRLR